jgi:hypothetical protein
MIAPAANAHTLYGQWVVYRKKHLLIGSHREDPQTYRIAKDLELHLLKELPEAKARVARAPHPERLASLLGTDQLEIAILSLDDAEMMAAGDGKFTPYGKLPLRLMAAIDQRVMVAHEGFAAHHAWLLSAAIEHWGKRSQLSRTSALEWHGGARLQRSGMAMPEPE